VFVPNFCGALCGALAITDSNRHLLRSGYAKRRPEELAVLARCGERAHVAVASAVSLSATESSPERTQRPHQNVQCMPSCSAGTRRCAACCARSSNVLPAPTDLLSYNPVSAKCGCGRWFPADHVQAPPAAWLDVILYSREQLLAERAALPRSAPEAGLPDLPDAPWGIISIKVRGRRPARSLSMHFVMGAATAAEALPRSAPAADLPDTLWGIISVKAWPPPRSAASQACTSAWGLPQLLPRPMHAVSGCHIARQYWRARMLGAWQTSLAPCGGTRRSWRITRRR